MYSMCLVVWLIVGVVNCAKFAVSPKLVEHFLNLDISPFNVNSNFQCCDLYENQTINEFEASISMCANRNWKPRLLTPAQVSWKPINENATDLNSTRPNNTVSSNYNHSNELLNKNKKPLKEYLVFVLVIPNHPFSIELLQLIEIIGPMFPQIQFVVGNGYEFGEMRTRYHITTFPKLIFLKNGIFNNHYKGARTLSALIIKCMKWTSTLPSAKPYFPIYSYQQNMETETDIQISYNTITPTNKSNDIIPYSYILDTENIKYFYPHNINKYVRFLTSCRITSLVHELKVNNIRKSWNILMKYKDNCLNDMEVLSKMLWVRFPGNGVVLEPVIGYSGSAPWIEKWLYLIAGLYSMTRLSIICYRYVIRR